MPCMTNTLFNYNAYEKVKEYKVTTQNEMNIGGLPPTKRFVYSLSLFYSSMIGFRNSMIVKHAS